MPKRGRAALVVLALTTGAVMVTIGAPSVGASAQPSVFPATGFGVYTWMGGTVRQISAEWRVPTILSTSPPGNASTWIGAQNQVGPPFVQLGTVENGIGLPGPFYGAFWSDPAVGFHPQDLGQVHPGDLVSADMVRTGSGWRLTFRDMTRATVRSVTVGLRGAGSGTYNQGEWLQEDPAPSGSTSVDVPYPTTTPISFDDVVVNDAVPTLPFDNGQTMLANGGVFLAPTAFTDDTFSFFSPTGTAKEYLEAASKVDAALSTFNLDVVRWSGYTDGERRAVARSMGAAFGRFSTAVGELSLSTATQHLGVELEQQARHVQAEFTEWVASGCNVGTTGYQNVLNGMESTSSAATTLRASLGLAPT